MWVLGLNAFPAGWHDSAACLVDERGDIVAFVEEGRMTRRKHAIRQGPVHATGHCLRQAGISPGDVDVVAVGWDVPYVSRIFGMKWSFESISDWLRNTLGWELSWRELPDVVFVPHHLAHATVGYYASGWDSAAVLVIDGNGDVESTSIYHASPDCGLLRKRIWPRSHSLGWMYDATSRFVGFDFLEAGKTMGLAAYGRASGSEPWPLFGDDDDGLRPLFSIPRNYDYQDIIDCWTVHLEKQAERNVTAGIRELDKDEVAVQAAWSAQAAVESRVSHLVKLARSETGEQRVCLSGGVALNCSANGLLDEPVYAPPIPHDAGVALGSAWHVAPPREMPPPLNPFLGGDVTEDMPGAADRDGVLVAPLEIEQVCAAIEAGRIGAVAEGRSEVGPRALCHRSIVASPGERSMKDRVNLIKNREPWRPFGPVAFRSRSAALWEEREHLTRYMIGGLRVSEEGRTLLPAAIHVDGTTRPQVMEDDATGLVSEILRQQQDGRGVLINTSFNVRGQPIVNTGREALDAFRSMDLDFLVLGGEVYAKRSDWWRPTRRPGSRNGNATADMGEAGFEPA